MPSDLVASANTRLLAPIPVFIAPPFASAANAGPSNLAADASIDGLGLNIARLGANSPTAAAVGCAVLFNFS